MRTSKTTISSIKRANTQIHLWSKLHMRPICIIFFKTGPSGYPSGLFGSPTASSGDPTGPSGDPSGRPYIAHCTMLPLATKSCDYVTIHYIRLGVHYHFLGGTSLVFRRILSIGGN